VVDSLSCTILGSATKRLIESDLVVTQPSNNFDRYSHIKIEFGKPKYNSLEIQKQQIVLLLQLLLLHQLLLLNQLRLLHLLGLLHYLLIRKLQLEFLMGKTLATSSVYCP